MNTSTRPLHTHSRILLCLGLSAAAILTLAPVGRAQIAGTLDDNFDSDGTALVPFSTGDVRGYGLARRVSGDIYIAGWLNGDTDERVALARLNPDGELDLGFDADGKVMGDYGQDFGRGYKVICNQITGLVTVVGQTSELEDDSPTDGVTTNFAIAQFDLNGDPYTAFGTNGATHFGFSSGVDDKAWDIAEQADGKYVVVGWTMEAGDMNYAIARLNADGTLDNSFSFDGKVAVDFNGNYDFARAVALQPDGKILVSGTSYTNPAGDNQRFSIMRLMPNGTLDNTFSDDGKSEIQTTISPSTECWDIALQPDGKIVLGGYEAGLACLSRLNPDGSADLGFGTVGTLNFEVATGAGAAFYGVALQADNKILAAGYDGSSTASNILLARFLPDGSPDTDFSFNGSVTESFATGIFETARDIYVQPDNKIVLGGYTTVNDLVQFVLLRYHAGVVCSENAISASATPTDVSCNGDSTGEINLTVTPSGSYTYDWSNGATSQDLNNVPAGDYSVLIVNSDGCSEEEIVMITEPPALLATWSTTEESSGGDGAIDLTASGGTPGYSYAWSNGSTSQDISGLSGGTYSVTVTDMNGCTSQHSIVIDSSVGLSGTRSDLDRYARFDPRTDLLTVLAEPFATKADLFDLSGSLVSTIKLNNGSGTFSVPMLPTGVYYVRLSGQRPPSAMRVPIIH